MGDEMRVDGLRGCKGVKWNFIHTETETGLIQLWELFFFLSCDEFEWRRIVIVL